MWLRIAFPGLSPVLAAVGEDGKLYFMAKSVGSALGYKSENSFADRRHTADLCDLVPEKYRIYLQKGTRKVFDFEDMMRVVKISVGYHGFTPDRILAIERAYFHGRCSWDFPEVIPFSTKTAHPVIVYEEGGDGLFREWLRRYVELTLEQFGSPDARVLEAPMSVESDFGENRKPAPKRSRLEATVRAEGSWTVESGETFRRVMETMKDRFEEMDGDFQADRDDRAYELRVTLCQVRPGV